MFAIRDWRWLSFHINLSILRKKEDFIFKNKTYLPINLFNCCQQLLSESNHVFGGKKLLQVKKILRYKKIFGGDPLYYHVFITIIVPYLFYHYQF